MLRFLVLELAARRAALPLSCVVETMRPLAIADLPDPVPGVLGAAVVRGVPHPVVDLDGLLGNRDPRPAARWVRLRAGNRWLVLAVPGATGVEELSPSAFEALPRLLDPGQGGMVGALSVLDSELLMILDEGRLLPADLVLPDPGPGGRPT